MKVGQRLTTMMSVLLIAGLTGCSGSSKTLYHTLDAGSVSAISTAALVTKKVPSLGVGPVYLSSLLDRSGVVLRQNPHTVSVSETHEWGGEFEDEFIRALAEALQARLPEMVINQVPWELENTPQYQVVVRVNHFDGQPGGEVRMRGRWTLQAAKTGKALRTQTINLKQVVSGKDIEDVVRTQGQVVGKLADQITASLEKL